MSDETTKSDYDDVLSSVRRIVSTEIDAAADKEAGKLLLTPALRVSDADASPGSNSDARDYPTLEDRIADLEAAVSADAADWEPDGSEDQAQHKPDGVVLPLRPADATSVEPEPEAADNAADPIDDIAAADAADDGAGDDDPTPPPANTPEPREPVAPPLATFRHRTGSYPDPIDNVLAEDEPALLDETALRDLVAEIVREELQGGLGERITRNVRKLVRAEIQRAFAARDLD